MSRAGIFRESRNTNFYELYPKTEKEAGLLGFIGAYLSFFAKGPRIVQTPPCFPLGEKPHRTGIEMQGCED
jgi:hypothetical protein